MPFAVGDAVWVYYRGRRVPGFIHEATNMFGPWQYVIRRGFHLGTFYNPEPRRRSYCDAIIAAFTGRFV